ncbi:hypothetical protein I316_01125 [Kwoniella heveanensis BCC8398]|uniref:Uncharacterized protein n=1 Tax=Kwoniella heveanensis BCC8398 TaxID=1296120 RepID=A0A1B9H1R1_9TREE|nr:hypothetical protein I316_01125 [Kwoniella heveanensis BCC8398]
MSPHAQAHGHHGHGHSHHAFGHHPHHQQPAFFPAAASSSTQPQIQPQQFPTLTRPAFQPHFSSPGPSASASTSSSGPSQPTPIPSMTHVSQSRTYPGNQHTISLPTTPAAAGGSSSSSRPQLNSSQSHSQSQRFGRPRPIKKPSGSTSHKQRNVQMSLEVKVEKAKGFHAFFVPLCKGLPPAPPCSPVHSHGSLSKTALGVHAHENDDALSSPGSSRSTDSSSGHGQGGAASDALNGGQMDYFGIWGSGKERDQWVEDVDTRGGGDGMEVDAVR